jgi:membrane-associated phospholipid phosphatase
LSKRGNITALVRRDQPPSNAECVLSAAATLEQKLAEQSLAGGVHPQFGRGVALGRAAGDAIVTHLMNDGFTSPWTGSIPVGPGLWTTTTLPPGGAMMGAVTPYFLESAAQFRPVPPPAFGSPAFDAAVNEVLTITSNLTQQQLAIALGWNFGGGTPTPPGYWNALAASYVESGNLDEAEAAEVFAMMNAVVVDALIAGFEAKYHYWTLRPKQADPAISYAFPVPNYPAYPSVHGSVSSSAARVLAHFFPNRAAELNGLVVEAAESRIYAGIHYRFDMTASRQLGEAVADFAIGRGLP